MTGLIDVGFKIPCLECGKRTEKTIRWIQTHGELICECGAAIDLDATEETKAVRTLKKTLKRLDKPYA